METIKGIIEKVIFTGEDNYAIVSVKIPGVGRPITACGKIESPVRKVEIIMEGSWGENPTRKEKQFYVSQSQCKIDKKIGAAIQFLSSGLIKYVGEATAREIVNHFGTDLEKIIKNPNELLKIKGLTERRLPEIIESLEQNKPYFGIYNVTNGEITKKQAEKIYRKYGDESVKKLKENPYILIYDINGFGFKKADALARKMGFELESPERCRAGLLHSFREAADEKGHCFLYYHEAMQRSVNLLINVDSVKEIYYRKVLCTSVPDLMGGFLELPLGDMAINHKIKFNNFIKKLEEAIMDMEDIVPLYDENDFGADEIKCLEVYLELKNKIYKEIDHILHLETLEMTGEEISTAYSKAGKNLSMEYPYHFISDRDKHGDLRYYDSKVYFLELQVALGLVYLAKKPCLITYTDDECKTLIDECQEYQNIELGEEQKEAVKKSLQNRVFITTGGPGRGKTTIETLTIVGWKQKGGEVKLLAPTGRAAQRMTEATGESAKTIHRELAMNEMCRNIERNDFVSIIDDVDELSECGTPTLVLIDEMSMCTLHLMSKLLKYANEHNVHLGFIGDANQLPCIGLGNVFEDMIKSEKIACTKLITCYRNSGSISHNADIINAGGSIRSLEKDHAFKLLTMNTPEAVQDAIIKLYGKMLERFKPDEIGIIVPCRQKGRTCANEINRIIQEKFNPKKEDTVEVRFKDKVFRIGDRVIHTRNCYKLACVDEAGEESLGVFNGETGTVSFVGKDCTIVGVRFDDGKTAIYDAKFLVYLELAYAITIHKAQGSEYKCVIAAFVDGDYSLLCRKIIYTAETRAKELMVLLGFVSAIGKAISNAYIEPRNTTVAERIIDIWNTEVENPWKTDVENAIYEENDDVEEETDADNEMLVNKMGGNKNMTHAYIVDTTPDENGMFYKGASQNAKADNMAGGEAVANDISDNTNLSAKERFIQKISFA